MFLEEEEEDIFSSALAPRYVLVARFGPQRAEALRGLTVASINFCEALDAIVEAAVYGYAGTALAAAVRMREIEKKYLSDATFSSRFLPAIFSSKTVKELLR